MMESGVRQKNARRMIKKRAGTSNPTSANSFHVSSPILKFRTKVDSENLPIQRHPGHCKQESPRRQSGSSSSK
jgi:hypothetical protein